MSLIVVWLLTIVATSICLGLCTKKKGKKPKTGGPPGSQAPNPAENPMNEEKAKDGGEANENPEEKKEEQPGEEKESHEEEKAASTKEEEKAQE